MKSRTLKELRELAKARGLRGYSKLTKEDLVRQLELEQPPTAAAPQKASATATPRPAKRAAPRAEAVPQSERTAAPEPAPVETPRTTEPAPPAPAMPSAARTPFASTEELVEGAKYALRPNGRPAGLPAADLDEDIDRLPALTEPLVCLLPQKPGILYAYWVLPPGTAGHDDAYKLRLCRAVGESLEVHDEVPAQSDRGNWYFHVPEPLANAELLVQLGYYHDGKFVAARGRSVARLPSLYASTRTDERWWINEADFMRMYLRAGGFVTPARRYGWSASIGSPGGGGPAAPEERLAWPGGVSSQS